MKRQPELRNYTPPWYDRAVYALTDLIGGEGATRDDYRLANTLAGPEMPFNLPARLTQNAEMAGRGGVGNIATAAGLTALDVAPLAGLLGAGRLRQFIGMGQAFKAPASDVIGRAGEFAQYARRAGIQMHPPKGKAQGDLSINKNDVGTSAYVRSKKGKVRFSDHFAFGANRQKQAAEAFPSDTPASVLNRLVFDSPGQRTPAYRAGREVQKARARKHHDDRVKRIRTAKSLMPSKTAARRMAPRMERVGLLGPEIEVRVKAARDAQRVMDMILGGK